MDVARYRLGDPAHARWLAALADELYAFYAPSADRAGGGFDALDGDGRPMPGPKQLLVTSRMTYCAVLGTLDGRAEWAPLVEHGLAALRTVFHDVRYRGWMEPGTTARYGKQTYQHAFVLLAAATAHTAGFAVDDVLAEVLTLYDRRLIEPASGLPVDAYNRAWTTAEDYRGVNATMHSVEALLAGFAATGDDVHLDRADRMAGHVVEFAATNGWRIPEHFTADWQPLPEYNAEHPADPFRPYGATPGHAFEWARLLLQLDRPWALAPARALFDRAVTDGWDDEHGGLVYTTDRHGRPVVIERLHWPITEAIGAACALHRATSDDRYAEWYARFWHYADEHFIDHDRGGWVHELTADGAPSARIWSGKPDMYHALQATYYARVPLAPALGAALTSSGRAAPS